MPRFRFDKLVRDKLPRYYEQLGQKAIYRVLSKLEHAKELKQKIIEEIEEIPVEGSTKDVTTEIADAPQGINDLMDLYDITEERMNVVRLEKLEKKGGFKNAIFVESLELQKNDEWIAYYRAEPTKYEEEGQSSEERRLVPGIYVHYKSDDMHYDVLGVGRDTETNEDYVVYKPLYEHEGQPDIWVRPYDMFVGTVEVDGVEVPRFRRIDKGV